jgi:competence protein ComEC
VKLVSVTGNQTFNFPDDYVLKAGASVNITAGPNATNNPPTCLSIIIYFYLSTFPLTS